MRVRIGLVLWLPALLNVLGLEESEAGVIDWHKELVGVPLTHSIQTVPAFIRSDPASPVKKTGIAVVTKSNVLSVINPGSTGNIVWRRVFDKSEGPILQYKTHRDAMATISGPGGAHVRLFEAFTGALLWERQLHSPNLGRLLEPPEIGVDVAFGRDLKDIDAILISRIILTDSHVITVGLLKSGSLYGINIITLDRTTGSIVSEKRLPSRITRGLQDVLVLSTRDTRTPAIAWFDQPAGTLRSVTLDTPDEFQYRFLSTNVSFTEVHEVGLSDHGLFIADTHGGPSWVIGMESSGLKQVWEFSDVSPASKAETPSSFSGGTDREGHPYIARLFWSHSTGLANVHFFVPHAADGQGMSAGFMFPFDTYEHGVITHCAFDAFMANPYSIQHRLFIVTSTGAVQLWQREELQWTRDEALTDIKMASLVDLPERKIVSELGASEHRGFGERLVAHMVAAQDLPQFIVQFAKRFATGSYPSVSPSDSKVLERDAFGFRKMLVVATGHGTLLGVDTATGTVVWRRIVGISSGGPPDVVPFKLFLVKSSVEGPNPEMVLVAERTFRGKNTPATVVYRFEVLTGELIGAARGYKMSDHGVREAFLVPGEPGVVGVVTTDGKIGVYPQSSSALNKLQAKASSLYLALPLGSELHGYTLRTDAGHLSTTETWKKAFTHPATSPDTITASLSLVHRPVEPVASYGRVLGDRATLYKYLSPHAAVVLGSDCAVRVVDLVSGSIVYDSGALNTEAATCEVPKVAFAENWLVYAYETSGNGVDKGTQVVSVELYEGQGQDDKTSSPDVSSFTESSSRVHAVQQSFLFPFPVVALGTTVTKFGISTKGLLLATSKNQVYNLHRRMLDPRRPMQKPNAQEQEEMLVQYDAILPADTRRIITHKNQVLGIENIITSPTLLESTSCVLVYGLDLFHTRVTPSGTFDLLGAGFNKVQLVLTIVGLSVAIAIVRPLVARKQLHAKWYS
ncbi:endoplasmic reticulum membrane protein [Ceratobasidium sp. AG-Ba]|nr:endoplasmic reticulum membrane protein [Ceratobasidium sp. AG-Ba]